MKLLGLVHVVAYPVVIWLVWVWLGIAESSAAALAGSAALGLLIVAALAWLLATAFDGDLRVRSTWGRSLLFVVAALCLAAATLWLNRPILWLAFGAVIAILIPPLFVRTFRVLRNWRYWAAFIVLLIGGGYVPWKVVTWVPAATTLTTQAASMAVRFSLAYLISVLALLMFAWLVRRLAIPKSPSPAMPRAHDDPPAL